MKFYKSIITLLILTYSLSAELSVQNKTQSKTNFNASLTQEEKEYLKNKSSISVCYPINLPPYSMKIETKPIGINVELLNKIEHITNIKFDFKYAQSVTEHFKMLKDKECDTVPMVLKKPNVIPYLNPTLPLISDKLVLVTRHNEPYMLDMSSLENKKIGLYRQHINIVALLKSKFPNIHFVLIDDISLDSLLNKEIDGYVGPYIQMSYMIMTGYNDELKIMFTFDNDKLEASMGVHVDEPILLSILNKAIKQLDTNKMQKTYINLLKLSYEKESNHSFLYALIGIFLFIISVILYANRKLNLEIKKRKHIQDKLKVSEERFKTFFDIAPILIDGFDSNGKCIMWNKECEKVFGWKIDEINKHEDPVSLFYPNPSVHMKLSKGFEVKSEDIFAEWYPHTKSGKQITTVWANVSLPDGSVICMGLDITDKREAELDAKGKTQELKEAKIQLEALNKNLQMLVKQEVEKSRQKDLLLQDHLKMVSLGEMIENIAHQWRQPLAQINSAVLIADSIMQQRNFSDNQVEEKLLEIESLTQYMSNTISIFQDYSHPNKEKSNFHILQMLQDSLYILKGALESASIEVVCTTDKDFKHNGYKNELQQVILVILNNAKDMLILNKVPNPKIVISTQRIESTYLIEICDNAGGIDPLIIEKIFEPYFTTKHKSQGTGLGLYISKMIIEDGMKGRLSVKNNEEGACFQITISTNEF